MDELERLIETLLYEGYALYPYTPSAIKNSTPTPFGIVYPAVYAADSAATFDHARLECVAAGGPAASVSASVRFLQGSGEGHQAVARRLDLPAPGEAVAFEFDGLVGRAQLHREPLADGLERIVVSVHNGTEVPPGLSRPQALRHSLLSCHLTATISGGRFVSPLERDGAEGAAVAATASSNTYPVLVGEDDRHVLGAAIILPDHPQIAPESRTSMFDGTEIEEALMLHVMALSDGERAAIADSDPAIGAMLDRATAGATPEDLLRLHGRVELRDPVLPGVPEPRTFGEPPSFTELPGGAGGRAGPRPGPGHLPAADTPGEPETEIAGVTVRPGSRVVLRPVRSMTGQDVLLDGKAATIERIYRAYDDKIHLGVTVDDDPGQQLMREIGRFLFFDPTEVEVIAP